MIIAANLEVAGRPARILGLIELEAQFEIDQRAFVVVEVYPRAIVDVIRIAVVCSHLHVGVRARVYAQPHPRRAVRRRSEGVVSHWKKSLVPYIESQRRIKEGLVEKID